MTAEATAPRKPPFIVGFARNVLAGLGCLITLPLLTQAIGTHSGAGAALSLITLVLLLLLTSPGNTLRKRSPLRLPGMLIALVALISFVAGTVQENGRQTAATADLFAKTGEQRIATAKAALGQGRPEDAMGALMPIIQSGDPRVRTLDLAATALLAAKGDREQAAKALITQGLAGGDKEGLLAAVDALDPKLRSRLAKFAASEERRLQAQATASAAVEKVASNERKFASLERNSHTEVVIRNAIREQMNDPSSFRHVASRASLSPDGTAYIHMTFRGKNALGGVVTQTAKAHVTLEGELLSLEVR